jgi:hypothetical protein
MIISGGAVVLGVAMTRNRIVRLLSLDARVSHDPPREGKVLRRPASASGT